jgi:hypothetical protein
MLDKNVTRCGRIDSTRMLRDAWERVHSGIKVRKRLRADVLLLGKLVQVFR